MLTTLRFSIGVVLYKTCEIRVLGRKVPRLRKCQASALALISLLILAQILLARPILNLMLLESIRAPAANWATYIIREVGGAPALRPAGAPGTAADQLNRARIAGIISSALGTGTVSQIDLLRPECMCAVSLGRGTPGLAEDTPDRPGASLDQAIAGLFDGTVPMGQVAGFGDGLVDLDPVALDDATREAHPTIELVMDEDGVARHGAVTFVSRIDGQPTLVLRLLMSLSEVRASQKLLFGLASIVLTAVSSVVIGLAARAIYASRRAEAMSDEQAQFLAQHDPMTGLLNREGFMTRAEALLADCSARGVRACLIQYDADGLKEINDLYGHPAGDAVIGGIARLIRRAFPEASLAARLDGDEFAVLIEESLLEGEPGARDLPTATAIPLDASREIAVSASAGFAFYPDDGRSLIELMKAADLALNSVKSFGKNNVAAYNPGMAQAFERRAWEIDGVRQALRNGEIRAHYQPVVDARTHRIVGFESLMRWEHPELGTLMPASIASALDDPETAIGVTEAMARQVTRDLAGWRALGHAFSVGLNVGESDLRHPGFLEMLDRAIAAHGLPHDAITIEVTERALNADNTTELLPVLWELRQRGMSVCLDDFGTGTSSIVMLSALPCSGLKIDKSFVAHMNRNENDMAIVRALCSLGHDLGIKVVAEGVETVAQAEGLAAVGAGLLQGFLFARSVPAHQVTDLIAELGLEQRPLQENRTVVPIERARSMSLNTMSRAYSRKP